LDIGKQIEGHFWLGLRGWIGLALAVAIGGAGEYIRDRIVARRVS
jgi:hypothetical protein